MEAIKCGSSRAVVIIGRWAFKFPRFVDHGYGRFHGFIVSLTKNIQENRWWRDTKHPKLCPVVFHLPFGLLNVMPKCKPIYKETFRYLRQLDWLDEPDIKVPAEYKIDSFGFYDKHIVVVDYGD